MKQGTIMIFRSGSSSSNGHYEQPAVVTKIVDESTVNLMVLPDCGVPYSATNVEVLQDEETAMAKVNAFAEQDPPLNPSLCWPA